VADANGDGKPDLFVSAFGQTDASGNTLPGTAGVYLFTNTTAGGNISFTASQIVSVDNPRYVTGMDAGDLNGDGFADLAFAVTDGVTSGDPTATLQVYAGDGTGSFMPAWAPDPAHAWNVDTVNIITYNGLPGIVTAGYNGKSYLYASFITDDTAPDIEPSVSGTLGDGGWYTSDVSVSWTVTDAESEVTSTTGCDATTVTADTTGVTFTCEATSAGGTSSRSVTIKRDTAAPAVTSVTAGPSALWPPDHKMQAVAVSAVAADSGSGGVVCRIGNVTVNEGPDQHEPDVQLTGDLTANLRAERTGSGTGRIYAIEVSCQDAAGNSATGAASVVVAHDQGRDDKGGKGGRD
jgi:hypothetical protein